MLTQVVAHVGQPVAPHDLAGAWSLDPLLLGSVVLAVWLYHRGRRGRQGSRRAPALFLGGLAVVAVALMSPLDAMSTSLASAHMVQHVLLIVVAAPLLALSRPGHRLVRGLPRGPVRRSGRLLQRLGVTTRALRPARHPAAAWFLLLAALWGWHAAVPYQAAVEHEIVHVVEHATFLGASLLFWSLVVALGRGRERSHGLGVLLLFGTAMHSVFLSALMTFADTPWYPAYSDTTAAFGLTPLQDQQLAGAIMWVPAGAVYIAAALALMVGWLRVVERDADRHEGALDATGITAG